MFRRDPTRTTPEFINWSGSLRFTPGQLFEPRDEQELAEAVQRAASEGRRVRSVGYGHSSVPLAQTPDLLVSLERLQGLISHDTHEGTATIWAGMHLRDVGETLNDVGLALHNYGDVATQVIAGAFGTGTHGTGRQLRDLSSALSGVRLVTAAGEIQEWNERDHPEQMKAARVSLGTLGIFTRLTLNLLPAYDLHRREYCTTTDACLEHLDELIEENRNFDFYWYPRSDEVKLRTLNEFGQAPGELAYATQVEDERNSSHRVIPRVRTLKFDEMEYAVPLEAGPACFREVRARVREHHRQYVGWRVLYRTIKADDSYLSNAYGRDTVTISLHQNAGLEYWRYFLDIEPIFRAYGGRPHWGKKHSLGAGALRGLYPRWDDFQRLRREVDPQGVLLNDYTRALLEEDRDCARDEIVEHEARPELTYRELKP